MAWIQFSFSDDRKMTWTTPEMFYGCRAASSGLNNIANAVRVVEAAA